MNKNRMIHRFPHRTLRAILSVLLLCSILIPFVSSAPTATATVPPVLLACSHAKYPAANFSCSYPKNQTPEIPEGPPYTIECTDNSTSEPDQPIVTWRWEFGDGGSSSVQHPKHSYAEANQYDIKFTVTTWCGAKYSSTATESVSISCSVPEPKFTTNVSEGFAPLSVQVIDLSANTPKNITTWTYWFDDNHFSHQRNPVFVYNYPGIYTINQTVWKDCVQMSSNLHPPYTRQIIVNAPGPSSIDTEVPVTVSMTTPATTLNGTPPVITKAAVTSEVPVSAAPAETTQNAPMPPGTGMLSMSTVPAGAQVYVDNVLQGTTPVTVPDLTAGSHILRLEREGYTNMTVPVQINDGKITTFATTLAPVSSGIAILPVAALTLIVLGVLGMGIYLFRTHKKE
jgi:PKD repeat protein